MAKNEYKMTAEDAVDVLATTIEVLREAGIMVGLRNAPAKGERPPGLMIFAGNVQISGEGGLSYIPDKEAT